MSESRLALYDAGTPASGEIAMVRPNTVATAPRSRAKTLRMPSIDELHVMTTLAASIAAAKMYPGFDTEAKVMTGLLYAYDLDRPFSVVLANSHIINGQLGVRAAFMHGLVNDTPGFDLTIIDHEHDHATVEFRRPEWSEAKRFTYTVDDARQAGLPAKNDNWIKRPREMCAHRAISIVCKAHFPEIISGLYTEDELREIPVEADGRVLDRAPRAPAALSAPVAALSHTDALKQLHAAGARHGLEHEAIKRYLADRLGVDLSDLPSLSDADVWPADRLQRATQDLDTNAAAWVARQLAELEDAADVDPETGEIVDADTDDTALMNMALGGATPADAGDPDRWTR